MTLPIYLARGLAGALAAFGLASASAQERPPLAPLDDKVGGLVLRLGESQIDFMQGWVQAAPRGWNEQQLEGFRGRILSATIAHPDVRAVRAAQSASVFAVREARAPLFPQVSTQLSNGRIANDPSTLQGSPARNYNSASVSITVRQLLYDFGATRGQIDASNARQKQAEFRQYSVESEIALKAIQAYHDLIRTYRQMQLAQRNLEARQAILDLVRQRQDIGGGTVSDVVRAESRAAEAEANLTAYQRNLGVAQASYREYFPGELQAVTAQSTVFDIRATGDWLAEVGLAGQQGWKVRSAQAAQRLAEAELKATRGRSFASINLEVSAARRDLVHPGVPGTDQSIALVARQTLFGGWADTARVDQAVQKMRQSAEELRSAELEYRRQLDQLVLEVEAQERLVTSRQSAARLAAESLRMIREQYAYRRGTLLDLLTAQESLYFAGRDLIDAQVDRALSTYKLMSLAAVLNNFVGLPVEP
jgi:adhesin transport system outer membrane protein